MNGLIKSLKKFIYKMKFRLKAAEYMRVAYLMPREVVLITTRFENKNNKLPVDWHMPLSFFPKLYSISLESKNYSSSVIEKSGFFCVNFMPAEFEEKILQSGRVSGTQADKFELTGLQKKKAEKINVPVLTDAIGWIECEVTDKIITGDHTLFIGKVVYENLNRENLKEKLYHITKHSN